MKKIISGEKETSVVSIGEYEADRYRVYVYRSGIDGTWYKLCRVSPTTGCGELFAWCNLNNSTSRANSQDSFKHMLKYAAQKGDLYEFNDFDEFVEWYSKNK